MTLREFAKIAVTDPTKFKMNVLQASMDRIDRIRKMMPHVYGSSNREAMLRGAHLRTQKQVSNILSRLAGRYA